MTQQGIVLTLKEIADLTSSRLVGNPLHRITHVADLENANASDASFLSNERYAKLIETSQAGVIFIAPQHDYPKHKNFLVTENPSAAFQVLVDYFFKDAQTLTFFSGVHPTAVVHSSARIGKNVTIGPHAVLDAHVLVGDNSTISAGCYIGPYTSIGSQCFLHPHVVVRERCTLGNRVILQPGTVIGSCGFGYVTNEKGEHNKLNQVGTVVLEDDVEIGANTTIDRARFKATVIGKGTKIDNLVQIGHGVEIGAHNIIVSQTGIAGSSRTGKYVILAGQCAVAGHISICDHVVIAGKSGVSKSITKPGKYGGIPVQPLTEYNRNSVHFRNLQCLIDDVKKIKEKLFSA